jgi:PAS domain S-box-containing protein
MPCDSGSRAHILAPHGRDAQLAQSLLGEAGINSAICGDLDALVEALDDDTLFGVISEEAIRFVDLKGLSHKIAEQPGWSDMPFIVLTQRGGGPEKNPNAARASEILGNVTFLERPFHPTTFVSVARSAAKSRQRQFEVRALIEQMNESEERLKTALLAGRLGSWELDLDSLVLTASSTCKAIFGRGPDDSFTYADLLASVHEGDRERMRAAVEATVKTGQGYSIEYRNVWSDGSVHWVEVRARRVRDRRAARRLVGVSLDITERKSVEAGLVALNETLEQRVTERTRALEQAHKSVLAEMAQRQRAEEQLRQAQKMEMIGQLTGGVAHDFNNLLMAVLGNLELLRKYAAGDARALRLVDGAIQGAERGARLTQRLLAFARRQDLQLKATSVDELVRGIADLLLKSVGQSVELSFEFAPGPLRAIADANQLELALLNLIINARDAMPDGGTISVTVDRAQAGEGDALPPGSYIRLAVQDDGLGMDSDTLQKAIEPFFSTKELGKGTGLGLSMIHGLALQLGGALRLTSQIGEGTRAELWLPEAKAGIGEDAMEEHPQHRVPHAEGLAVLIVDDDALIAMSTAAMIEDLGHLPIEAYSGDDAIQVLESDATVDLLITDFAMPKMNGAELARQAAVIRPGLPILLATGYAELPPGNTVNLPRIGKPFRQEQLQSEISRLITFRK